MILKEAKSCSESGAVAPLNIYLSPSVAKNRRKINPQQDPAGNPMSRATARDDPKPMATEYKDYYEILGVTRAASDEEIRTAFRRMARLYHPDKTGNNRQAE